MAWGDVWLRYMLHFFVNRVHVVDVSCLSAVTVFSEVAWFATVEARPFGTSGAVILLHWCVCCVAILGLDEVGVRVVL
jgi:hypothetical protein